MLLQNYAVDRDLHLAGHGCPREREGPVSILMPHYPWLALSFRTVLKGARLSVATPTAQPKQT